MSRTLVVLPQEVDVDMLSYGERVLVRKLQSSLQTDEMALGSVVVCKNLTKDGGYLNSRIGTIWRVCENEFGFKDESSQHHSYVMKEYVTTRFSVVTHGLTSTSHNSMVGRILSIAESGRMVVQFDTTGEIRHIKLKNLTVHQKLDDVIMVNDVAGWRQHYRIPDQVVFFTDMIRKQQPAEVATCAIRYDVLWPEGPRVNMQQVVAFFGRID